MLGNKFMDSKMVGQTENYFSVIRQSIDHYKSINPTNKMMKTFTKDLAIGIFKSHPITTLWLFIQEPLVYMVQDIVLWPITKPPISYYMYNYHRYSLNVYEA